MRHSYIPLAVVAAVLTVAGPTQAFHRSTPAIVPVTDTGSTDLPRIASQGRRSIALIEPDVAGTKVVTVSPHKTGSTPTVVFSGGDNQNPAVSGSGQIVVWDSDADPVGAGAPGRQVIMSVKGILIQAALDPTGTSENPDVDNSGRLVVFESTGDLAATGNLGARQIFLREKTGLISQVSTGQGDSHHPMLSRKGKMLTYESSSDPITGTDTGVTQIFVGRYNRLPATRITAGAGASRNPALSDDGRIVVFESLADLAGSGAATGVPQIFAYDQRTETSAQLTADPGGCTRPAASRRGSDWRITFVCGGEAQYFMLRDGTRYRVPTPNGTAQSILPELGSYFVTVSTTANLLGGGTTAGYQLYMINDYIHPAEPMAGTAIWFPYQGIF